MNMGLAVSYVIGGIILFSILMLNLNMSLSSTELTMSQIAQEQVRSVAEIISYDIPKIGYNRKWKTNSPQDVGKMIEVADSNKIVFYSNIDNDPGGTTEQITWEFTTTPVSSTENPDDYILKRIVDGVSTDITLGVTRFFVRYDTSYGRKDTTWLSTPVPASDLDKIRQIEIEIECQTAFKYTTRLNSGRYIRSAWEKRFSPANLESTN